MSSEDQPDDRTRTVDVEGCLPIGSILDSNSHIDYTVEIFNKHDRERPPEAHEWGFGQPVFVHKAHAGADYAVVGVVYDTRLVDPDQGRSGPRLAQTDQERFTPGYVEERTTLAGLVLLGLMEIGEAGRLGPPDQSVPRWTLEVDDQVRLCPSEMAAAFHTAADGSLQLAYADRLVDVAGSLGAEVTLEVVDRLREAIGGEETERVLDVIERNIEWQSSSDRGVVR
jgi:hypothetical protein